MKYFLNSCSLFVLFNILSACSSKTFPTGNYQQAPVIADGDLSEWDKPIRFVSSGGQVLHNVTNDNENIYIGLETHDDRAKDPAGRHSCLYRSFSRPK